MLNPINLLLLYGGRSGEHEVSLISAASVLAHLDKQRYRIIPVGMDKDGCFYQNSVSDLLQYEGALPVVTEQSRRIDSPLANGHLTWDVDVVFPVVHGPLYEDGCLQGLLELAGVAYVGCGVLASAMGMDKDMARRIACIEDVRAARYRLLPGQLSQAETESFCQQAAALLGWPLFVKPCSMGSSVGIHKVHDMAGLLLAVADARRYDREVLIEEFVLGREIEVAVLEQSSSWSSPRVSLPGEIRVHHTDGFYSYKAKYLESQQTDLLVPALLSDSLVARLQRMAADIFIRLKCQGMARVDFFVNDKTDDIYFNEINTIPGFTSISMYPKMWQASGISYSALLDHLIDLAMVRYQANQALVTHYQ